MSPNNLDFYTAVGLGLIPNCRRAVALGNNPVVDTATVPEDIWPGGGAYPWKTTATLMEAVSANAADAAAGTGARTIIVQGLDANYVEISETVTLNGTTPVALVNTYFRINAAFITSAGSGKVNAGDISIRDSGGGTVRSIIQAGYGQARQAIFTVPAGHTLEIHSHIYNIIKPAGVAREATISNYIQSPNGFYRMILEINVGANAYRHDGVPSVPVAEKTDYALRVTGVSANNTNVLAGFLGILIKNTDIRFL